MGRYAQYTKVPVSRSRSEIEDTLKRFGASQFAYGDNGEYAIVGFSAEGRQVKFYLPIADLSEQEIRQRWRALAMVIKAKLASVEDGIEEFEDAFMAHIVLPDGQRVGDWMRPQLETSYTAGDMPPLLAGPDR